jgi:uncharacterized membrane-anchored protein
MLNKVPEVTLYFWVIKILCTTVGETAADFLNTHLHLGLTGTSVVMGALLITVLFFQFRARRYIPSIYWTAVVLISIVGTLITDNLVDNAGVPLQTTTIIFAIALAVTFAVWFAFEKTLSIHTIFTTRREAFYWLAVLFTFALGTAGGDLAAEKLSLGYWLAAGIFAGAIALTAALHYGVKLNAVFAFWVAYILTRPLGASLGDGLSQPSDAGGFGLGTVGTSAIFLGTILALVLYLTRTRVDATPPVTAEEEAAAEAAHVLVVADGTPPTPALLDIIRGRATRGPAQFQLLVTNPDLADWHLHPDLTHAEQFLETALPRIEAAAGKKVDSSPSSRHDPMDAIEEALRSGDVDEIILSTHPHKVTGWLHIDLPRRVEHLGVPVMTVMTDDKVKTEAG